MNENATTAAGAEPVSLSSEPEPGAGEPLSVTRPEGPVQLTVGEAVGLAAVTAVACVGIVSLLSAQWGWHNGWLAAGIGVALTAAIGLGALAFGGHVRVRLDRTEVVLVVGVLAAALFMFLPGWRYTYADKDPGIYVAHAFLIAREGNVEVTDPVEEHGLEVGEYFGRRFPGVWPGQTEDTSTSQFYHYYSSLLATADDIAGARGLFNATPLMAALSVSLFVLAARRATNTTVAAITGALLVTSMMQVWQSRYPSTETLAQLFLSGALLAAVLAINRRWAPGAFVAGLLTTTSFLARPDGVMYVMMAIGIVAVLIALARFKRLTAALALGLALPLPYAAWNGYVARIEYTESLALPSLARLSVIAAVVLLAGVAGRLVLKRLADRAPGSAFAPANWAEQWQDRWQRPAAIVGTAVAALTLLFFWFRADLFGYPERYSHFVGEDIPTLNPDNLRTLALYVTEPGLLLMLAGVAVLLFGRSRLSLYMLLLPGLAVLPIYLWNARVSMRLMWWVRRFIPGVLPVILLLIALALAWAIHHRFRSRDKPELARAGTWALRGAAVVTFAALVGTYASQSLPLRNHHEMGGSWQLTQEIAAVPGDEQGVFLFTSYPSGDILHPLRNTPAPLWWVFDHVTARIPADYDMATVESYAAAFPDQPVYLLLAEPELPDHMPTDRFEPVTELVSNIVFWDESPAGGPGTFRPDSALSLHRGITVWQLTD